MGMNNPYQPTPGQRPPNRQSAPGDPGRGTPYPDPRSYSQSQYPVNYPYSQNPNRPPQPEPPKKKKNRRNFEDQFGKIFVVALVVFIVGYLGWLFAPRVRNAMTFWPTSTPVPPAFTSTAQASATVTPLASNTPTPFPTETPRPLSTFWKPEGDSVNPAVPDAPDGVIVLSVDQSAEVSPPLDSLSWTSSDKIAADLGKTTYQEHWYATYDEGWVRWYTDQPLREGLYEIYTMDTMYSSGGSLDFSVMLGGQELTPITGSQHVEYMTSQYDPVQSQDTWRSIGMYYLTPSQEPLIVTAAWQPRDNYTIVSVDRLLIVPRKAYDLTILNQLPQIGTKYVLDDKRLEITGGDFLIDETDPQAWDLGFQLIMNPDRKVTITMPADIPWPIGNYKIYAWVPTTLGGITADVKFFTDNSLVPADNGEESAKYTALQNQPAQWVEIGSWTTDKYYERQRKVKVTIEIAENQSGEFPVDALALIHTPF